MESWLASNPADDAFVLGVKQYAQAAESSAEVQVDVEAAFRRVRGQLDTPAQVPTAEGLTVVRGDLGRPASRRTPTVPGAVRPVSTARSWGRVVVGIAAVTVAAIGIGQWQTRASADVERVLVTRVGERDSLRLSDGSNVVLAPGSKLTVAADFDAGHREVTLLEGAADFDVHHDDAHPFTVRAAQAEIRDVGTAFTVKTDALGGVSVSVTHGTVALRERSAADPSSVELHAGDRGVLTAGAVAVERGTVTDEATAWTRGELSFRDTPLAEVQADLKRWYGVEMIVQDSALMRLTVTMSAQRDSASAIRTIVAALGADMEQHGDTIVLHSAGRGTTP